MARLNRRDTMGEAARSKLQAELLRHDNTRDLVSKPDLMHRLESYVALYAPGGQWHLFRSRSGIPVVQVAPMGRRLARALGDVERLMWDPRLAAIIARPGALASSETLRSSGGLLLWLEALSDIKRRAEQVGRLKSDRGRGRRPDRPRSLFVESIAIALKDAGVPISRYERGLFANVLRGAFVAAGEEPPLDLFRLVKRTADTLK